VYSPIGRQPRADPAVVLSNAAAGIERISRVARKSSDRLWLVGPLVLPVPGRRRIKLDILMTDFAETVVAEEVAVRR
jgi:copper transport protein